MTQWISNASVVHSMVWVTITLAGHMTCIVVDHSINHDEGIALTGHMTLECIASLNDDGCNWAVSATVPHIIGVDGVDIESYLATARTRSQTIV